MSFTISDTFVTANGPASGAVVFAFKASRFSDIPTLNTPPPSTTDAGPVTTGAAFGGPGQFQINVNTNEPYYCSFTYNGQTTYKLYNAANFTAGAQGATGINGNLDGGINRGVNFAAGVAPTDLAIVNQIAPGPQGSQGEPGIYIGPTPPPETDILWADTTDPSVFSNNGLFFNPVDYGADPNGVHDSTQAIQTCLFLGHTELPAGKYLVSNLYLPDGASITGRQDPHAAIYSTSPLANGTTAISQMSGATGSLITSGPTGYSNTIRNIMLLGGNTRSTTNRAIDLLNRPDTINSAALTSPASIGDTTITIDAVENWMCKASTLIIGTTWEPVIISTDWDGVSTTIPLVNPVTQNHALSAEVTPTASGKTGGANLRMENVGIFYFAGDYSVYWGNHRYGNKMEHCIIFGAGNITRFATGGEKQGNYVAGTAWNSTAVGLYSLASDCGIHASEFGGSASHNIKISCQPFGITESDIWSAGVCGTGNGVRVQASNTTTNIYIGSRTEFDNCANEAIYIEGNGANQATDVQIGPGCFFTQNCQNGATGGTTSTNPRANIAIESDYRGMATVMGTTAKGTAGPGGVDYNLNVQANASYFTLQNQSNRSISYGGGNGYDLSEVWFSSYSPNGANTAPISRFVNHVDNGMVDYIRHNGSNTNALLYYLTGGSSAIMYASDNSNNRADLYTNGLYFGTTSSFGDVSYGISGTTAVIKPKVKIGSTGATISSGSGAPSGSATTGDIYFRTDTPTVANQRIYIYTGSAWTGIV